MADRPRLLVVEDDPAILDLLTGALQFAGFDVGTAVTASEALRAVAAGPPDVMLLDIMLPDSDGFEVLRRIRGQGIGCPVLFLTARDGVADRVAGLSAGADDYVVKPFSVEEVIARIRAVLRREQPDQAAADNRTLTVADLELDDGTREARRAGQPIALTPNEFKLLRYLMANAGRVLNRAQIADSIWDYHVSGDSTVVESYISNLRRKVDTTEPRLIHTIRGIGYVLRVPP
ncbi:MAG TPA: response regulator transcription factor [Streptosporangiaceae bacterium]|nr:response regulator transcription factor [Streptosporangiaceae bacterium]